MQELSVVRWVLAAMIVILLVLLLAYARGNPGDGGRAPDKAHAHAAASVVAPGATSLTIGGA